MRKWLLGLVAAAVLWAFFTLVAVAKFPDFTIEFDDDL